MSRYSPDKIRDYYDEYGDREWERFDRRHVDRVSLEIHQRFLRRWIHDGDRVLEVGAGPGRFTILMAAIGARLVVSDISSHQLDANRQKVGEAGCGDAVEAWELVDVTDLSRFAEASFDVATAYGGPLSYVFDQVGHALDELLRIVRPGGLVIASVMSRWGALHLFLEGVLQLEKSGGTGVNQMVIEKGDLVGDMARVPGVSLPHECHLFTWDELDELVATRDCEFVDASASNLLSLRAEEALAELAPSEWSKFLDWEESACRSRGTLGAGTHILFAIQKPS